MRLRFLAAMVAVVVGVAPICAEESPYRGLESREVKALSEQQIAGYLGGKGMGLALAGELNGYPGPKHVLDLASSLELSSTQRSEVQRIFETMQSEAIALGRRIVAAETSLESAFSDGSIDPELLRKSTEEIGVLQGRLRAVHLQAHLETKAILSSAQVQKYVELRGYDPDDPDDHNDHSAMEHRGQGH